MYRHISKIATPEAYFNMLDKFEASLNKWAAENGYEVILERSQSCVFSKSIYISATNNDWEDSIGIRISDHSGKCGTAGLDKFLWWDDYKHPAECLKTIKAEIEKAHL